MFEGPRQNEYPNKPLMQPMAGALMEAGCRSLGYHPFPAPAANASDVYTNPEGLTLGACEYCGHCERFGCEANAKASPNVCVLPVLLADPKFELRTHAYVKELVYDKAARKVKAVRYVDTRNGEEYEQPAGLVILGAYVFNNVLLMLTSGIGEPYDYKTGKGVVGKNYCYQVTGTNVQVFFENHEINPFMAAGSHGTVHRRLQRRQLRPLRPGLLRRRLYPGVGHQRTSDRDPASAARHAALGPRNGSRPPPSGTTTPSGSTHRAAATRTARIFSTSIRPTRMRSAVRSSA